MSSKLSTPTETRPEENGDWVPGGFRLTFHWRVLGTPAPVFPGFEIDISDRIPDGEKPDAVWHRDRARSMLRDHPEIRKLFTRSSVTAIWCVLFAASQVAIAVALLGQPFWVVLLCAYVVGSWINICLFNLAHECNHGLVFGNKTWDRWLFTLTTIPMSLPGHHTWWIEHHVHHNDLGAKKDFVKRRRSVLLAMKDNLLGKTVPRRFRPFITWITTPLCWPIALFMLVMQIARAVIGLSVYAVQALFRFQFTPTDTALAILADEHLISGYNRYRIRPWAVAYPLISLMLYTFLFLVAGWQGALYLLLSQLFMTGFLHPLNFGLILSNSHFHGHRAYQPSSSYYGWLNWITFNFGLHTEHHDLEAVPWYHLGKLRKIAPEYYDDLIQTPSYAWLALRFGFGSRDGFNNEDHRNREMLVVSPGDPT